MMNVQQLIQAKALFVVARDNADRPNLLRPRRRLLEGAIDAEIFHTRATRVIP
jgi:hypothetical protein